MIRKSMPSDLIRGWVPVFPRDKREAFARRSCSNKKLERDDASKKSHPAPALLLGMRHSKWSWKISTRGTNAERSGLNEGGRQWTGDGPLNSRLNRPLRKFWALPRHVLGLLNNPW